MITTARSIEIERPAEAVFDFVTDFPKNPTWQRGMQSCRWTSEPPLQVGSTYEQHARFLGKDLYQSFAVVELDPGRRIKFTSTSGSFPITVTRTVDAVGESRARFTEAVEGDARGFYRIATPLLGWLVRRAIARDFPVLKRILEAAAAR